MNERTKSYEKITRKELNEMAKKKGMKYTRRYNRFELAEKLGIELSKPKPRQGKSRKARPVEILNSDGTTTIFNENFPFGNNTLSITDLLRKLEIVGYLEKDGRLTYASQREKLRRLLCKGEITSEVVSQYAERHPTEPRVQDTRYGAQRQRANQTF